MPRALIDRLQKFRERHYPKHQARYRELAAGGQSPGMLLKQRRTEEFRTWLLLTAVMAPVLAVALVSGYGFVVWMVQTFIAGPPTY
jgi:nitrate reductase NapE